MGENSYDSLRLFFINIGCGLSKQVSCCSSTSGRAFSLGVSCCCSNIFCKAFGLGVLSSDCDWFGVSSFAAPLLSFYLLGASLVGDDGSSPQASLPRARDGESASLSLIRDLFMEFELISIETYSPSRISPPVRLLSEVKLSSISVIVFLTVMSILLLLIFMLTLWSEGPLMFPVSCDLFLELIFLILFEDCRPRPLVILESIPREKLGSGDRSVRL
jgi:hypothetical protein